MMVEEDGNRSLLFVLSVFVSRQREGEKRKERTEKGVIFFKKGKGRRETARRSRYSHVLKGVLTSQTFQG